MLYPDKNKPLLLYRYVSVITQLILSIMNRVLILLFYLEVFRLDASTEWNESC